MSRKNFIREFQRFSDYQSVTKKTLTEQKSLLHESFRSPNVQWYEPLGDIKFDTGGMGAREYGASRDGGSRKHAGYDVGASNGSPLYNIADGTVIEARKTSSACGPGVVFIEHDNGIKSRFCHVNDIMVSKGDEVKGGCQFGKVARGHMHIEIYHPNSPVGSGRYMNPRVFHDSNNFIKHNGEYCGQPLVGPLQDPSQILSVPSSKPSEVSEPSLYSQKLDTYYSDECKRNLSESKSECAADISDIMTVDYLGKQYQRPPQSDFVEDDIIFFDGMDQGRLERKNEVREIQRLLINRNYKLEDFGVDGKFGPETLAAVNAFQRDHGLTVKGVVDEEMMNELEVETNINHNPEDNDPVTVQRYQLQPWEQPVVQAIKKAAEEYGIDVKDAMVIAEVESSGNPQAKNAGGCLGLYQFCPKWIKGYGLNSQTAKDPYQNSLAFAKSIRKRIDNFKSRYGRDPKLYETYIMWNQGESGANQIFDAVSEGTGVPRRIRRNMRAQGNLFSDDPVEFVEAMKKFVDNKQSQFESRGIKI